MKPFNEDRVLLTLKCVAMFLIAMFLSAAAVTRSLKLSVIGGLAIGFLLVLMSAEPQIRRSMRKR